MNYNQFKSINDDIKASDFNGLAQRLRIMDYNKATDTVFIESVMFTDWISVSTLISEITNKRQSYLTNPSKLKTWHGWTK